MAQTRRLAAILAADVVGYSRLMGEDEAGTAKAVREHREAATVPDEHVLAGEHRVRGRGHAAGQGAGQAIAPSFKIPLKLSP